MDSNDITPEEQAVYERELRERARLGRKIMVLVCLLNLFVSFVIPMAGLDLMVFGAAVCGLVLSLRGRALGRSIQIGAGFMLAECGFYALVYIHMAGVPDDLRPLVTYLWFMSLYGTLTCVYTLRSRNIESWFEYAGSYKFRCLGRKFFRD